jgi:hypothetical protein
VQVATTANMTHPKRLLLLPGRCAHTSQAGGVARMQAVIAVLAAAAALAAAFCPSTTSTALQVQQQHQDQQCPRLPPLYSVLRHHGKAARASDGRAALPAPARAKRQPALPPSPTAETTSTAFVTTEQPNGAHTSHAELWRQRRRQPRLDFTAGAWSLSTPALPEDAAPAEPVAQAETLKERMARYDRMSCGMAHTTLAALHSAMWLAR